MNKLKQNIILFSFVDVVYFVFCVIYIFLYSKHLDFTTPFISYITLSKYSFFSFFIIEMVVEWLFVSVLCNSNRKWMRLTGYFCLFCYNSIYLFQLIAQIKSHAYITSLAIGNIMHIDLVFGRSIFALIILVFVLYISFCVLLEKTGMRNCQPRDIKKKICLFLLLIGIVCITNVLIPTENIRAREEYYKNNNITHSPPMVSFIKAFYEFIVTNDSIFARKEIPLSASETKTLNAYGLSYSKTKYPLMRYPTDNVCNSYDKLVKYTNPNIIIFFTEGFSARAIGAYGGPYSDLTPNIDNFIINSHSMKVINYFNHTAATYRGIAGQLCSIYPQNDGYREYDNKASSFLSLASMLNIANYNTIFLDPHFNGIAQVANLAKKNLGFRNVYSGEEMLKDYLPGEQKKNHDAITDQQLYRSLIGLLKDKELKQDRLLVTVYNLGTHAWMQTQNDEVTYKNGDNSVLNSFHELDNDFGMFWRYFLASAYKNNTIVIFTADHSHFYEKEYLDAFNTNNMQKLFIDRIPLIIYDPIKSLPSILDAKNSTSIDFLPTVLEILAVPDFPNPFAGNSLFREGKPNIGISAIGTKVYFTTTEIIFNSSFSTEYLNEQKTVVKYLGDTYWLQNNNYVMDPSAEERMKSTFKIWGRSLSD